MKINLYFPVLILAITCAFALGCSNMQKPLMQVVTEDSDMPTEPEMSEENEMPAEPEPPTISFDVNLPENEYPEGFTPLESDRVFFRTDLRDDTPVYEDLQTAVEAEATQTFFVEAADFIEKTCKDIHEKGGYSTDNQPGLNMYFKTREDRDTFVSILPESVEWVTPETIHIVHGEVYYYQHVRVFITVKMCVE